MILDGAASLCILLAVVMALGWAPPEATMGHLQRILYCHVSTAWVGFLALFLGLAGGIMYLRQGEARSDDLSHASVEIGFAFVTMAILTGSMWAKPVWGTWWAWEPRLTTAAILWLMYLAYFMLRSGIDDPGRGARLAAVYAIVAFSSVPLTFLAILWWRGMHPVMGGLRPRMVATLLLSVGAFTLLYVALLRHRMRLADLGRQITSLGEQLGEGKAG